jgi:hypothetical protein
VGQHDQPVHGGDVAGGQRMLPRTKYVGRETRNPRDRTAVCVCSQTMEQAIHLESVVVSRRPESSRVVQGDTSVVGPEHSHRFVGFDD